jgi:starch-binding outer membrane protein, SusD/RagB family
MNKYIINLKSILIVGIMALYSVSCSDLLDKNPLDQISIQTYWTSEKEVQMALTGVYSRLQVATFNHDDAKTDVMAGESDANQSQAWVPIAQGDITSTSGSLINEIFTNCYLGISSCNIFLDNVDKAPIAEANMLKYKAEVQFLRALFYLRLADVYGGVPLYTKQPASIDEAKVKQSTKEQVITQVLADLDFAIANLPDKAYTDGHAVKGSALALKARTLLYQSQWAGAAAAAKEVMDGGKFSIFNNFNTLFLAKGQGSNPEIIFSTRYLNPDAYSDLDIRWNWHGVVNPRRELIDDYECTDGLPITSSPLYDPTNWKLNRDPRLLLTIKAFADSVQNSSGKWVKFAYNGQSASGYNPYKYGNWDCLPIDYSTKSEQDWIILRYADVLLMYAEATNEATGPDQSVYDAVNAVRARPGINMPPIPTGLSKDQMRERIRHERRTELGMEGLRWADIKRWKTAEIYINTLVDVGGVHRKFVAPTNYLMPFPQSEIDVNPQLEQNPGY